MAEHAISVLIVDDDALIRKWFSMLLTQIEGETLQLLEAGNGEEALRICRQKKITLVVTDIKMPLMDGITLIKTLKEEKPGIRTAVLSAYDDFEYVQVALRYGALDYVLKVEMQPEDIRRLMKKLRENLNFEQGIKNDKQSYRNKMRAAQGLYKEFLQQPNQSDVDFLRALHPLFTPTAVNLTMMRLDTASCCETPFGLASAIYSSMLTDTVACAVFPVDEDLYLLFSQTQDNHNMRPEEAYLKLLAAADQNLRKYASAHIMQNIKVDYSPKDDLRQQLLLARDLIDYQIYYSVNTVSRQSSARTAPTQMLLEDLQKSLEASNAAQSAVFLQEFVKKCHEGQVLPQRIRNGIMAGTYAMLETLEVGQAEEGRIEALRHSAACLASAPTLDRMEIELEQFCRAYKALAVTRHRSLTPAVVAAVEYIEAHYAQRLSLGEVACGVAISASYLSHLFTKELKISFVEQIEKVRIRNAQRLLRTSHLTMIEVAQAVGYPDQNYFAKVFKKVTGLNPTQYRKKHWG